jgi:hypothetical protein
MPGSSVLCFAVTLEKLRVPKPLEPETMLLVLSRGGKKSVLSQEHFIAVSKHIVVSLSTAGCNKFN